MNPVVHFEMPFEDRDRMATFYTKAFGWKPQMMGPDMGDYVVMTTTELDPKTGFPTQPGRINGGFFKKSPENSIPSVVIGVKDIRKAMQDVVAAGGKLMPGHSENPSEPDNIPGVGLYVGFVDSEGNRVSMIQPTSGPMIPNQ
jgi:predicted enzyme related to lactoylglutathione lyase